MIASVKKMRAFYRKLSTELLTYHLAQMTPMTKPSPMDQQIMSVIETILCERGAK